MKLPLPEAGLVIRYSYLWQREHAGKALEGRKARPCAVILASQQAAGLTKVMVAPLTTRKPATTDPAVALPPATLKRLGLEGKAAWVIVSELNDFIWPGFDLEPVPHKTPATPAYGILPPKLLEDIKLAISKAREAGQLKRVKR
jgi:hypothetical protein